MASAFPLRMGIGPKSGQTNFVLRGLSYSLGTVFKFGLSQTNPIFDIVPPNWPNYVDQTIDLSSGWTNLAGSTWENTNATVVFPVANIPQNTYYDLFYFYLEDLAGNIFAGGNVFPEIHITANGAITFNTNCLILNVDTGFSTTDIAFPSVTYPGFTPTYEPAALGVPIKYFQNMRS